MCGLFRGLAAPMLAATAGAALAQPAPAPLTLNETVEWSGPEADGQTFTYGGTRITVALAWAEGNEWVESVSFEIERAGAAALTVEAPAGFTGFGQVGVYEIGNAAGPVLVVGAYTGGAHCCEQLYLIDLGADGTEPVDGGMYDGGTVAPVDADGDGRYEFVVPDPRFHYTFDCYACGGPPAAVFTLRDGEFTEISAEPRFRFLFVEDFNRYSESCGAGAEWTAGVCAGLLGAAARLGIYEGTLAILKPGLGKGGKLVSGWEEFSFCANEECTQTTDFNDFVEAVDYALHQWGYLGAD